MRTGKTSNLLQQKQTPILLVKYAKYNKSIYMTTKTTPDF